MGQLSPTYSREVGGGTPPPGTRTQQEPRQTLPSSGNFVCTGVGIPHTLANLKKRISPNLLFSSWATSAGTPRQCIRNAHWQTGPDRGHHPKGCSKWSKNATYGTKKQTKSTNKTDHGFVRTLSPTLSPTCWSWLSAGSFVFTYVSVSLELFEN